MPYRPVKSVKLSKWISVYSQCRHLATGGVTLNNLLIGSCMGSGYRTRNHFSNLIITYFNGCMAFTFLHFCLWLYFIIILAFCLSFNFLVMITRSSAVAERPRGASRHQILTKSQMASLDFTINRFFMKLFSTGNIEIVQSCQEFFGFELPSTLLSKRIAKFESVHYNPWLLMMNSVTLLPCRKLI